ncbi:ABC-type sugar transport system, periplasmic component [Sphaerochaeta pleomorpha str. Grapes]|uniref:ABC-type sugar transport system, periplasmic component n=1 Tax=Sphaerochaeta pleomorpha (strain ATCC BAA-1885 / DSM 22778 / Grapes) TaxID=158190 RepID=G8QSV1_SPHPG|nr:sugar ABC transporter substrate-binding protein [Sphaerochaeta pleomorpha]AEV30133.1 ABC-type sugar transport system, periplasmic component [Sphaerochaeta pleomorpha str. Grapes]
MKKFVKLVTVLSLVLLIGTSAIFAQGGTEGTKAASGPVTVNVALANNPLSQALAKYAQQSYKADGVNVNISVLPENDLRQKLTTGAATKDSTYDIIYIGPYEAQTWAKNGWLENLKPYFDKMTPEQKQWYDYDDLIKGMLDSVSLDGIPYGIPFYGETSFLMYNKDLFAKAGLTMPEEPTWDQVYAFAKKINDPANGIVGMTMRGAPGWGMSGAPFTTMINAFGAQFYDMNWNATIDTPAMRNAWMMYKKILTEAGQKDILSYTYNECIALMSSGKCGMYYDATSLAPPLEASDSAVRGHIGYVMAPHDQLKKNTAWLWNWTMCINPNITAERKQAAFDFILWATSKDYVALTLKEDPSCGTTPSANRYSTYKLSAYAKAPYAAITLKTLQNLDFTKPTLNPAPYVGLQYMAIPEFADIGTAMTEYLADYVVNKTSLDEAIRKTQAVFEQAAKDGNYKK